MPSNPKLLLEFIQVFLKRCWVLLFSFTLVYCNQSDPGKALAHQYCSSCHQFPEPDLLPKRIWETQTLPAMALYMGRQLDNMGMVMSYSTEEFAWLQSQAVYPVSPVLSDEKWAAIKQFYLEHAPDSLLPMGVRQMVKPLHEKFDIVPVKGLHRVPAANMVKYIPELNRLFYGLQNGNTLILHKELKVIDSIQCGTAVSDIIYHNGQLYNLDMGILPPSDLYLGMLYGRPFAKESKPKALFQRMNRPVEMNLADLNADGIDDWVINEFGHHLGSLFWLDGKDSRKRHDLKHAPGARTTKVLDVNADGNLDLVTLFTQGRESIVLFENKGKGNFEERMWLEFPSVYGSSYFELADLNADGHLDVVYANGDNADYSVVLKPYHGIRIFLNQGNNRFVEQWFHPMNGAAKTHTRDFDGDGDLDIATISFFPDLANQPEEGFYFFENKGNLEFDVYGSDATACGRWLVMDGGDIDNDGDEDIVLGSSIVAPRMDAMRDYETEWRKQNVGLLVLKNRVRQ